MTQFAAVSGFPESAQNFLNALTSTHGESGVLVLSFSIILVKVAFHHYPCLLTQRALLLLYTSVIGVFDRGVQSCV